MIVKKRLGKRCTGFHEEGFLILISSCCTCILFIYCIIYSILLVSLDSFDDSNTKENYNKSSLNIIKKINGFIFLFDGIVIATPFIFIFYLFKEFESDYGIKKFIKSFIVIIINIAHFLFEGLVIWKLVLSYRIKKSGITWFMKMDYIFLILNFIYIAYLILISLSFFAESGIRVEKAKKCTLNSFNWIKIKSYSLPYNFDKWKKNKRKKFILNNYHNYEYIISSEEENIVNLINNFRILKGLQKLEFKRIKTIPEFIINKPSELFLNSSENIFKLSDTKYLIRYPKGNFEK